MCIYERSALAGILLAGLAGAAGPETPLRYGPLALWAWSAWKGLALVVMVNTPSKPVSTHSPFSCWRIRRPHEDIL
ncbi:hypothetical protein F3I54_22935 [Pantoea sp. VH_18]|nr:hypothetical protein F3I59_22425 [Pantoea sp. VH_8]KAA5930004.1 hypothetical protein F3I58_19750 [Pantoea sp. VH_4]KAA5951253.1 hypothetical protein F3I55_20350 [Pantoea sp. VH_24]KAA5953260.1 hypothetical protein F3I53_22725 [Pantoea sp. VH_16]KAA5959063.1 hypothetical protein F3I54_22935 [Pantoea sp. VH_18]KAA5978696.1 hypothetical protein F3I49_22620 [Pantoea sp. M_4]KAA5991564.1 hypothetical protein F3I46_22510 [Pantoea sp. M_1]